MTYKSFLRKKTTHIYLFILFLLIFIFSLLLIGKQYYINIGNEDYKGSYLSIITNEDLAEKLKKVKDIKNIREGLYYENNFLLKNSQNLKENEIIVPKEYKEEVSLKSTVEIDINNIKYEFLVIDYNPEYKVFNINNNLLETLKKDITTKAYILDIKNWANNEKVVNKLSKIIDSEISIHIDKKSNIKYENTILVFNAFIILNIFLFLIILIITIFNILEDEKKNNMMYKSLGFSKKNIIKINILKVILLLAIVLTLDIIIVFSILKIISI